MTRTGLGFSVYKRVHVCVHVVILLELFLENTDLCLTVMSHDQQRPYQSTEGGREGDR